LARKSLIVKAKRNQKFSTRTYNRCPICGRSRAFLRKFGICRICFSYDKVEVPSSKIKINIVKILKFEGYIRNYKIIKDSKQGILVIYLKYNEDKSSVIKGA